MIKLQLSQKQQLALNLLDDPQITEIYYAGSAGGGKTMMVCLWMLIQCRQFPGIRIGLGRKELTRLKQTTVVTLLREAHKIMQVDPKEFNYQDQKGLITYSNNSQIQLIDLIRQPSDPDFDTLGSSLFTHVVIEESGEIVKKAKDVFGSRKNRFMNNEYGIVGKTVLTGNPSQNFTRDEYYEPYKAAGAGDFQKWESGQVEINGKMNTAYRAFIKALPTDNPFLPQNYIEVLKQLPLQERKRLYEGNWDYLDDDDMLFKSELFNKSLTGELRSGEKFVGVDPSDKGKDKTSVSLIEDGIFSEHKYLDADPNLPQSEAYALSLIRFLQQRGMDASQANHVAVESNGIGVGMRDFMRSKGWHVTEYTSTAKLRSQNIYNTAQDMDNGHLQIYSQLEILPDIRKELMVLTYEFNESLEPVMLKKDKVKEILGYSPDASDSFVIANWIRRGGYKDKKTSRVIF